MTIYLIIVAILLLNFLIAIMSETYGRLKDYSAGMKYAEVIKIRAIYEDDPYYSCLVRSLPITNLIVLFMLPFILICKSKSLNSALLRIEYLVFQLIIKFWLLIFGLLMLPFTTIYLYYAKFQSICFSKSKNTNPVFAFVDFCLFLFLAPFNAFYILLYWLFVIFLHENRTKDILKVTEIHQEEFIKINEKCDKSYGDEEDCDQDLDIFLFKKSLGTERNIEYNPSNMMLAETTVAILIAVLKQSSKQAEELGKDHLPTAYIIKNL